MSRKPRRVDFHPDEFIAGTTGRLSMADLGVYWMVCTLIYSKGEAIDDDHVWLARLFKDTHWREVRAALDRLIAAGKITRQDGGKLVVMRCAEELQDTRRRIASATQNGRTGGRPRKENNEIEKPAGSSDKKLTTNHQPSLPESPLPPVGGRPVKEAECKALFERWYAEYPRKEDPGRARRAFDKALGKTDFDTLFAGVRRYAAEVRQKGTERQYVKHPTTWLNAEAWRNEADVVEPPDPLLKWRHRLGMWSKDGYWNSMTWGPEPGQPGCDVPPELLTETRKEVAHANG